MVKVSSFRLRVALSTRPDTATEYMDEDMNKLSKMFGGFSELINVKSIEAMGIKFFASVAIVLAAFWISKILQRSIDRHMGNGTWNDDDAIFKYKITGTPFIAS